MNNTIIQYFQHQLKEEAILTRAMLRLVPADKYDWQPHPKVCACGAWPLM